MSSEMDIEVAVTAVSGNERTLATDSGGGGQVTVSKLRPDATRSKHPSEYPASCC